MNMIEYVRYVKLEYIGGMFQITTPGQKFFLLGRFFYSAHS